MQPLLPRPDGLTCDGVPVEELARTYGTPLYVYSGSTLVARWRALDRAFAAVPHQVLYSVKANSSGVILRLLSEEGSGADVVSGGELVRALRAGIQPDRIVFAGVGKTDDEIVAALDADIALINIESPGELARLKRILERRAEAGGQPRHAGGGSRRQARIAFRITPGIVGGTHHYTETGTRGTKFGMPEEAALEMATALVADRRRAEAGGADAPPPVDLAGLHVHFGSQITRIEPFVTAAERLRELTLRFREAGADIRILNMGGGLGITYDDESPPTPDEVAGAVIPLLSDLNVELFIEPGRWIVGPAGLLVARVIDVKRTGQEIFVIIDAAMNDLIRPALYDAYHDVLPVIPRSGTHETVDLVGPICESGDFLARNRRLPPLLPGDLVVIRDAGAYGFSMASNYNSRPRAAEVLVESGGHRLIRRRETIGDLIGAEKE